MEYTDLTILDCNRQHSVQVLSGNDNNPALFTNELGKGVELNIGDTVSIQGAYISEVGAGSDTIEFKGVDTGKTRTINYIKEKNEYPTNIDDVDPDTSEPSVPLINGFQRIKSEKDTFTYTVKDNETYISKQYYLNTNGESGYTFLPRRFIYPDPVGADPIPTSIWSTGDQYVGGRSTEQIAGQFASCDYMFIAGGDSQQEYSIDTGFFRLRSDNSRLTLMRRMDLLAEFTLLRDKTIRNNGDPIQGYYPTNTEPCEDEYQIFTDYCKISLEAGFSSPENIASQITKQLKEPDTGTTFSIKDNQGNPRDITITYNSNTHKPFLCGSIDTFSRKQQLAYVNRDDLQSALNYNSNFYNIYCKRPELRITGQSLNGLSQEVGFTVLNEVLIADRKTKTIRLSLEWNNDNLILLSNFFKAQKLYPELFDNDNFHAIQPNTDTVDNNSVDNTRFLHINRDITGRTKLGGDNLNTTDNGSGKPAEPTKQSVPIFFYFDKRYEGIYSEGNSTNNLSYGFATKYTLGLTSYIELHPELIGGINEGVFGDGTSIKKLHSTTSIGFDFSFNSYGGVYACGINGRSDKGYLGVNKWAILNAEKTTAPKIEAIKPISGFLRYNYVGADNPLFKYDPDQQRFYFSNLHTPELAGQSAVGAGDNLKGEEREDNTQNGGAVVYKVNKRVSKYTYTPDMRPYVNEVPATYKPTGMTSGIRNLVVKNRNINSWSIFDSVSGVYFTDLGYDKEDFRNSMWGILGFTYDQLFSPETSSNNRTVRVSSDNKNNLNIITTNATVVPSDLRNYIVNEYGAVYFTNQIPSSSVITSTTVPTKIEMTPAISQATGSINILAQNLPRKMLRPYYTIRSDIIDNNPYIGGINSKTTLPVVGICDKQYSGGDYYFGSDNEFTFTITKKKVITSITTAITDPNQTFARVDNDSAVIYKVIKNITQDTDIISKYLQSLDKKK